MAVLSTLLYRTMTHLQAYETSTHQVCHTSDRSSSAISTSSSVSHSTGFASRIGSLYSIAHHVHSSMSEATDHYHTGNGYEPPPIDGPQDDLWFCPNCGDGPYGSWQVSCANCYRNKSAGYPAQHDTLMDYYANIGPAPMEGPEEVVWFCSDCGDGPIGSWQNVCQACQHQRCGGCLQEER
jgi:hypothetical protein